MPKNFAGVVLRSVVGHGTHRAADGCAGLVALVLVGLTGGDRQKVSEDLGLFQ